MDHSLGLGVDDLGDVLEETLSSSTKWYKIGLRLKVPVAKLDGIRREFSDQEDCLCEMLKEWLKGTAETRQTWEVLIEALKSQTVGETQLANQLEMKYCSKVHGECHVNNWFLVLMIMLDHIIILLRIWWHSLTSLTSHRIDK